MKVITIANAAGSAGKTTTTVTLAALLAQRGVRVVVIDLDGQANSTRWLGIDPDAVDATSGAVMLRTATLADALVETNTPGVRLVPASESVYADGITLQQVTGREMRLASALRKLDGADVVLIDCPGTIGLMTVAALVASDEVLTVTQPTSKELEGIASLEATIAEVVEDFDKDLELAAIVPCIVPPATSGPCTSKRSSSCARRTATSSPPACDGQSRLREATATANPCRRSLPARGSPSTTRQCWNT